MRIKYPSNGFSDSAAPQCWNRTCFGMVGAWLGVIFMCGNAIANDQVSDIRASMAIQCAAGEALPMSPIQPVASDLNTWQSAWQTAPCWDLYPQSQPLSTPMAHARPTEWPQSFITQVKRPYLKLFKSAQPNRHAVLVIPGGGYRFVSTDNEGVVLARRLNALGFDAYILVYRLPSEFNPIQTQAPFDDANQAMRLIKLHARELGIDAQTVSVMGFSAGGHLAARLSTTPQEPLTRPFASALIYPVITMTDQWTHTGSREALLGKPLINEQRAMSPERAVDADTPPAFLLHAADDTTVSVQNSFLYAEAMAKAGRAVTLKILARGGHGFGVQPPVSKEYLDNDNQNNQSNDGNWVDVWARWLQSQLQTVPNIKSF